MIYLSHASWPAGGKRRKGWSARYHDGTANHYAASTDGPLHAAAAALEQAASEYGERQRTKAEAAKEHDDDEG